MFEFSRKCRKNGRLAATIIVVACLVASCSSTDAVRGEDGAQLSPSQSSTPEPSTSTSGPKHHSTAEPATNWRLLNAKIPPSSCSPRIFGWEQPLPIQLHQGQGQVKIPGGPYKYVSILHTTVLGRADFNADGDRDVALVLRCAGSAIDRCCAGQASLVNFIAVFNIDAKGRLRLVAPVLGGSTIRPGDKYGPAHAVIVRAKLDGTTITTDEYVLYNTYSQQQLGGIDPDQPLTQRWQLSNGVWTSTLQ